MFLTVMRRENPGANRAISVGRPGVGRDKAEDLEELFNSLGAVLPTGNSNRLENVLLAIVGNLQNTDSDNIIFPGGFFDVIFSLFDAVGDNLGCCTLLVQILSQASTVCYAIDDLWEHGICPLIDQILRKHGSKLVSAVLTIISNLLVLLEKEGDPDILEEFMVICSEQLIGIRELVFTAEDMTQWMKCIDSMLQRIEFDEERQLEFLGILDATFALRSDDVPFCIEFANVVQSMELSPTVISRCDIADKVFSLLQNESNQVIHRSVQIIAQWAENGVLLPAMGFDVILTLMQYDDKKIYKSLFYMLGLYTLDNAEHAEVFFGSGVAARMVEIAHDLSHGCKNEIAYYICLMALELPRKHIPALIESGVIPFIYDNMDFTRSERYREALIGCLAQIGSLAATLPEMHDTFQELASECDVLFDELDQDVVALMAQYPFLFPSEGDIEGEI